MQSEIKNAVLETYENFFEFPESEIPTEHYREITIHINMKSVVIDTNVIISYNSKFEWFLESDIAFQPEFGLFYQGIPRYAQWDVVEMYGKKQFVIPLDQGGDAVNPPAVVKQIIKHFMGKKIFKPTPDYLKRYDDKFSEIQLRDILKPANAARDPSYNMPFDFKYEKDRMLSKYNRPARPFNRDDQDQIELFSQGTHSPIHLPEPFQRRGGPPTPGSPEPPSLATLDPLEMRGREQSRVSISPIRTLRRNISPIRTPSTPENPDLRMAKLLTPNLFGKGKKTKRIRKTRRKKPFRLR